MRKLWKLAAVTGVAVAFGTMTSIGSAFATPPAGYGFDNTSHVIVGGGSDTTYRAQIGLSDLWAESGLSGCPHVTANGTSTNACAANVNPETSNQGNYQGDTIAQANPVGSSTGIGSLNGSSGAASTYQGTVNPVPAGTCVTATPGVANVDFARSSRAPKTSGGKAPCGNELTADTFWGYAQDGVEVNVFTAARGAQVQGAPSPALTPDDLFHIWNCSGGTGTGGRVRWSDVVPSISPGSATDADIVPWQMNTGSGTFGTFQTYIQTNATGVPSGWSPNAQSCDRALASGQPPLENDIKPLVNDPAALATGTSADNPGNWIWWGSFGVFSAFPYTSNYTRSGTPTQAVAAPVNGILPSTSRIIANTYPIGRTLYNVTRKFDADCAKTAGACDFPGNPGPTVGATTDLNVTGGTSGTSGAVREYTRWLCRVSTAQHGLDPFTGTSFFSEITTAINNAGFTVVPSALRSSGSRCQVLS